MPPPMTDQQRFAQIKRRTKPDGECWIWQGFAHPNGYGSTSYKGKSWRVHRLMYYLAKGPIPSDSDVCHTCDQRRCVNPAHLWIGTREQNMKDCMRKARHDSPKRTHCPRGHEYNEENTKVARGRDGRGARNCRVCQRIRQRIKAGWPAELAESLPAVTKGKRPISAKWPRLAPREDA